MSLTCLSRTLAEQDYTDLTSELGYVDHHGINGQHPARRWEYALALHAVRRWTSAEHTLDGTLYDVVFEPTPFHHMLDDWTERRAILINPEELEGGGCRMLVDVITCLSIIEHVVDPEAFLYYASSRLAPGGLLILTMPFWMRCGPDVAVGAAERARIYCPKLYAVLRADAQALQLSTFGGVDTTWHGTQVHDYSLASLVLQKRP